jgi:hypothetical protein
MEEFVFGTFIYEYQLIRQNRKTLSLTVTPELEIILKCPVEVGSERVESFLQKKWFWLEKQLTFFKKYQREIYAREYVSGESFLYLGRQYKLSVKQSNRDIVSLARGMLSIHTTKEVSNSKHNKKLLDKWFREKTEKVFEERFINTISLFDYKKIPKLDIREMKKRWGSFSSKGKIFLNPKLIHTSKECIDYVVVHELCHFKYKNHDSNFWKLVNQKYPKWKKVKEKLETMGADIR